MWIILLIIIQSIVNVESIISYNLPNFCPNVIWNLNATTVVNESMIEDGRNNIFISINNTVYVTDFKNHRILVWFQGDRQPTQMKIDGHNNPSSLFVTINGDIYVENGNNQRVNKWILSTKSSTKAVTVNETCYGLFIDINNMLYCSVYNHHIVEQISLNDSINNPKIVAGIYGYADSTSDKLRLPWGIYVHTNLSLYVADFGNHRIQHFPLGETNGITVVGNQKINGVSLSGPTGIILDVNDNLFIADQNNNRIIRTGPHGVRCLFGCLNQRNLTANQLKQPNALAFDNKGNIFVSDMINKRIQKFDLISNNCNESISSQEITTSILQEKEITTVKATSLVEFLSLTSIETSITTKETLIEHFNLSFIPKQCNDTKYIGSICNISNNICITSNPCQNNGTCININNTNILHFNCSCLSGYNGTYCEFDHRLCKPYTCLNHGICNESSLTRFNCTCNDGWQGIHCESMINYCLFKNITCLNNGICRPLLLNYTCECLGNNYYSGRHCEIKSKKILIFKFISKSFSYIVIIALIIVVMFIVIMDVLKYCFGIDPVDEERQRIRRQKQITKRKRINIALQSQSTNIPRITVTKVTV